MSMPCSDSPRCSIGRTANASAGTPRSPSSPGRGPEQDGDVRGQVPFGEERSRVLRVSRSRSAGSSTTRKPPWCAAARLAVRTCGPPHSAGSIVNSAGSGPIIPTR